MIIELFGPPAAGKTTYARALAGQLMREGRPVELILSLRPAEMPGSVDDVSGARRSCGAVRRLARPAFELIADLGRRRFRAQSGGIASQLLELLPPSSMTWSLRLSRYIARLERHWRLASQADTTVIFDQGFVQCLCSLVLLAPVVTPSILEQGVALIPKANRWIKVEAPGDLLRTRLEARRDSQSWLERRLEFDVETSLRSIEVLSTLEPYLRRQDIRITRKGPRESGLSQNRRRGAGWGVETWA